MKHIISYIEEAITDELYHYTTFDALLDIVTQNRIKLGPNNSGNKKYPYRLSLTRTRNAMTGYGRYMVDNYKSICRICFDRQRLAADFKITPFAWQNSLHPGTNTKNVAIRAEEEDKELWDDNREYNMKQYDVEDEERLYFDKNVIKGILKYVTHIDIVEKTIRKYDLTTLRTWCRQQGVTLTSYSDKNAFILGKSK